MGKVVSLWAFKEQILASKEKTFEELLKKAYLLKEQASSKKDVKGFNDLKKLFEIQLNTFLLENKLIGSDMFLCASYIASLLSDIGWQVPESWYSMDYVVQSIEGGNDLYLRKGADLCFLLCSLFPERCNQRSMIKKDYVDMGISMYNSYYSVTGSEVTYHMAKRFELMMEATTESVQKI